MKKDKKYYGDTRLNQLCAFCGCQTETEDHVPSKCFLDKPPPKICPLSLVAISVIMISL